MNPVSGISSAATGGCASAWWGVLAGISIGARSRTSAPARSSKKIRAPFASPTDLVTGRSPVATARIRVNSARWVTARGIVTTPRGSGQRTLRLSQTSHGSEHHGRLLLVDEVPSPGHAVHDEQWERSGQDRNFLCADPALVCRRPEEQTDRAPHLGEVRPQSLRLAPRGHGKKRLERAVQIMRGGCRVTVDHLLAHPRRVSRRFDQLTADLFAYQLHSAEHPDPGRELHGTPKRSRGGSLGRPTVQ